MAKLSRPTLAAFALLFSAWIPVVCNAQAAPNFVRPRTPNEAPAPKVVFIGDWITDNWTSAFADNPNWINQGTLDFFGGNSGGTAARFLADVVSLHPDIVHIMVGVVDEAQQDDALMALTTPDLVNNLNTMVQEAKAANIQVVLGMEPPAVSPENAVIAAYGAANNIHVINYGAAQMATDDIYQGNAFVPTTAGYASMTQIAEAAISTLNLTLKSGYLQNVQQANGNGAAENNVNTVVPGVYIQFTPMGKYSDGNLYPMLNTNFRGSSGTWTSSNPLVMYVSPTGLAWPLTPGTATIRYTSLDGTKFSEWIMYVIPGT
jgi:hypothetical protein